MASILEVILVKKTHSYDCQVKISKERLKVNSNTRSLQTKYHVTKILQTETDSKCRLCKQFDETVEHIISACPIMAKEQDIKRYECALNYTLTYARK